MDLLVAKVDKVNLMCCTHMALLSTNVLIRHEELLKKISQRMVNNISQLRAKVKSKLNSQFQPDNRTKFLL